VHLSRFFWFLISILIGAAVGLAIGWYVRPTAMGEVAPTALRSDYRTDFVLMAAQSYDSDKNIRKASERLNFLGGDTPARLAQVAVIKAGELGYDRRDLELLAKLSQALLAPSLSPTPASTLKVTVTSTALVSVTPTPGAKP
jgi:hypothetical protein